ncbi:MAG: S8 family serine peptidase, partial [Candidatus Thorarchaeota archaeon]
YGYTIGTTAPGVDIYRSLTGGNVWGWWSGTSFSAAFASGLAAILRSVHPEGDPRFIMDLLMETADDIDEVNPDFVNLLGAGRINFLKATYIPGDANGSGGVNLGDVVYLVTYIFKDGPPPMPLEAGDADCDENLNVGDAVYLVDYVFNNGPEPERCD